MREQHERGSQIRLLENDSSAGTATARSGIPDLAACRNVRGRAALPDDIARAAWPAPTAGTFQADRARSSAARRARCVRRADEEQQQQVDEYKSGRPPLPAAIIDGENADHHADAEQQTYSICRFHLARAAARRAGRRPDADDARAVSATAVTRQRPVDTLPKEALCSGAEAERRHALTRLRRRRPALSGA